MELLDSGGLRVRHAMHREVMQSFKWYLPMEICLRLLKHMRVLR